MLVKCISRTAFVIVILSAAQQTVIFILSAAQQTVNILFLPWCKFTQREKLKKFQLCNKK